MNGAALALTGLLAVNLLTLAAFADDKRRARQKARRVPERVLLQLALIGGSPGAKLGQWRFRHKTRKRTFARRLNAIVALHVALVATAIWFD